MNVQEHETGPKYYIFPEDQKIIIDLALGCRQPQNESERRILQAIRESERNGQVIDLPFA